MSTEKMGKKEKLWDQSFYFLDDQKVWCFNEFFQHKKEPPLESASFLMDFKKVWSIPFFVKELSTIAQKNQNLQTKSFPVLDCPTSLSQRFNYFSCAVLRHYTHKRLSYDHKIYKNQNASSRTFEWWVNHYIPIKIDESVVLYIWKKICDSG